MQGGFILINKPNGITSHDVVNQLRKITKIKKIGHAGTLDPFAQGLLILAIGREYTRKLSFFQKMDKEYIARLKLGAESDTFDRDGKIIKIKVKKIPTKKEVKDILNGFLGEFKQIPPIFSAKKIKGEKAYRLARKGVKFSLAPQKVKIFSISLLKYNFPYLEVKVRCSKGTYLRSLAFDIGRKLGCGAYLDNLIRTKIGCFSIEKAVDLSKLDSENWRKFVFELKGQHRPPYQSFFLFCFC